MHVIFWKATETGNISLKRKKKPVATLYYDTHIIFASPVNILQIDSAIDVQMVDRIQRLSIFEVAEFF